MPAKYFRLPSATHGGLSLQDQGSENNGETSGWYYSARIDQAYGRWLGKDPNLSTQLPGEKHDPSDRNRGKLLQR